MRTGRYEQAGPFSPGINYKSSGTFTQQMPGAGKFFYKKASEPYRYDDLPNLEFL